MGLQPGSCRWAGGQPVIDVVIVGSGPVGAAYARAILDARRQANVVMVESGPTVTEPLGSHIKNIPGSEHRRRAMQKAQGEPNRSDSFVTLPERAAASNEPGAADKYFHRPGLYLVDGQRSDYPGNGLPAASATSCVGGMATQWTAACPRPYGSEVIPFISPAVMDAALDRAEELLAVSRENVGGGETNRVQQQISDLFDEGRNAATTVRSMPLAVTVVDGQRVWSAADTVLGEYASLPNLQILPNTRCTRVLMSGRTATGVEVVDQGTGMKHQLLARNVVIAAGSIHGSQVLFASGIRPRALGRYLNDHHMIVGAVGVSSEPATSPRGTGSSGADRVTGVTWIPFDDQVLPLHGQVMHTDASPVETGGEGREDEQVVSLGWFAAKDIQESDRIEFTDDWTDAAGMPGFTIHYELTNRDRDLIALAKGKTTLLAETIGRSIYAEPAYG